LFGDSRPGILGFDQEFAALAHFPAHSVRQGDSFAQRTSKGFGADSDPPTTTMGLQFLPRCSVGGDDGYCASEGFGDDEAEIFRVTWEDEQIGAAIKVPFGLAVDRPDEIEILFEMVLANDGFDFGLVIIFALAGEDDLPTFWPDGGPGLDEVEKTFDRMNSTEEKKCPFYRFTRLDGVLARQEVEGCRLGSGGHVHAVGDDGDGLTEAECAEIVSFLGGSGVEEAGGLQIALLVEQPGDSFFPSAKLECPTGQHTAWGDDERKAGLARNDGCGVIAREPKAGVM